MLDVVMREGVAEVVTPPVVRQRWICFGCRKTFRAHGNHAEARCPTCQRQMYADGGVATVPKSHNVHAWHRFETIFFRQRRREREAVK